MSHGDHEIGFALITPPPFYGNATTNTNGINSTKTDLNSPAGEQNFMSELAALLGKYNVATAPSAETELDVATGKLSLERINLLFKHMPVDLSYVDENELVKFYSDTKHRIFPRSANVIGREVRNCHPAKSVHLVEEIDEQGNFKGVLEMMQDCTRIRSLEDSRTLLTWDDEVHGNASTSAADATGETEAVATVQETATEKKATTAANNDTITVKGITITGDTKLFDLFDRVPGLRQHMPKINSNFAMLNTAFGKIMAKKATIAKASDRSGMNQADLIKAIAQYIEANL